MDVLGNIATVAQLSSFNAITLIGLIIEAARNARRYRKNCLKFASHLKVIRDLATDKMNQIPQVHEALKKLEEALMRGYDLVTRCQDRSYVHVLATGLRDYDQFREAQHEVNKFLRLVSLITLIQLKRMEERLKHLEGHQCECEDDDPVAAMDEYVLPVTSTSPKHNSSRQCDNDESSSSKSIGDLFDGCLDVICCCCGLCYDYCVEEEKCECASCEIPPVQRIEK